MNVFVIQTLVLLLLAFLVGWLIGWLLKRLMCPVAGYSATDENREGAHREARMAVAGAGAAGMAAAGSSLRADDDAANEAVATRREAGVDDSAFRRGDALEGDESEVGSPTSRVDRADDVARPLHQASEQSAQSQSGEKEAIAPEAEGSDTIELDSPGSSSFAPPRDAGAENAGSSMQIDSAIGDIEADNLQIIEGIGPKMESILHENGIATWSELASHSESDLRGILDQYGDRYRIINPESWIEQARLASLGKVDELIAFQKKDGVSKLETMINAGQKGGFGKYRRDDLKIVEGIGPKIAELLKDAGIDTWKKLAKSDPEEIQKILDSAGPAFRLADPKSWPVQAELADKGEWARLKEYQDVLQGGRAG